MVRFASDYGFSYQAVASGGQVPPGSPLKPAGDQVPIHSVAVQTNCLSGQPWPTPTHRQPLRTPAHSFSQPRVNASRPGPPPSSPGPAPPRRQRPDPPKKPLTDVELIPVRATALIPSMVAALATWELAAIQPCQAYVALMAGQRARALNGSFNNVPVLHSNQPEEVEGPGILINTAPGLAYAAENGQPLRNAVYTFQGEFGLHIHHKYLPPYRSQISPSARRSELMLATILINPGRTPVHIRFQRGAVRNSFEAPYLANNLMGVKPLGPRPWNTGPGDATAIQMLRGRLDSRLMNEITIPPYSRLVLFQTPLPALGIANALLRGHSDGPFQMAVVAASNPRTDADLLAVLDSARLAPGRVYLRRLAEINNRRVFSRVGGVALGDSYSASIDHDLNSQGPLHVPFTSTDRHEFGTGDVQVNPLLSRMVDSSLDNVGTYGVRFDIDLNLRGKGPYELVMSHPSPVGGRDFTAFRGSIQIRSEDGLQEVHVGLRSGQSLSLSQILLHPGRVNPIRVSMVYPADATPGHLLSVVPSLQLAQVQEQERRLALARSSPPPVPRPPEGPPPPLPPAGLTRQGARAPAAVRSQPVMAPLQLLQPPPTLTQPAPSRWTFPPPLLLPTLPPRSGDPLVDRYRQAVDAQRKQMEGWGQP